MTRNELLILRLAEECNEVAVRVSKALTYGFKEIQPEQPFNNLERIHQEMMDVFGIYTMLRDAGVLEDMNYSMIAKKIIKVEEFLEYSRHCGILTD